MPQSDMAWNSDARVYPILDTVSLQRAGANPLDVASALLQGGARILQFRHKSFWDSATVDVAAAVRDACQDEGAVFVINDRADYAALLAAGLHVGQDDLSPRDARAITGSSAFLGYSTHDLLQFAAGDNEPVDYLALGPVFPTSSKQNPDPVIGIELVRQARALTNKPLVAIGGITLDTAPSVWEAGADSVAIIGDLLAQGTEPKAIRGRMEAWMAASS